MWLLVTAAAPANAPKKEILGTWRGTSICTKAAASGGCHDETVLYEFTDLPKMSDTVRLKASKLVNGRFESMGEIDFRYEPASKRWAGEFKNERVHILWSFVVHGRKITGKCEGLPGNQITRNAEATRQ